MVTSGCRLFSAPAPSVTRRATPPRSALGEISRPHRRHPQLFCAVLSAAVAISAGCTSDVSTTTSPSPVSIGRSSTRGNETSHDFGWVPLHSHLSHDFVVKNNSDDDWEIVKVKSTCGCTTAELNQKAIKTGDELIVPVRVNSAKGEGRRTQRVVLLFAGQVPDQALTVTYAVRAPLSIVPKVHHVSLVPDQRDNAALTIENFSDFTWSDVSVTLRYSNPSSPWIALKELRELPVTEKGPQIPHQRWTASFEIDPASSHLSPGDHTSVIDIIAGDGTREIKNEATVNVSLNPRVRVIPQNLLIVESDKTAVEKTLTFWFADEKRVPSGEDIRLSHDFPVDLRLNCNPPQGHRISAKLTIPSPAGEDGTLHGKANIQFGAPVNSTISVSLVIISRGDKETNPAEAKGGAN